MTKQRALLATLIATKAMEAMASNWTMEMSQGPGTPSPVDLTLVSFLTVRTYPANSAMCADPPTSMEFWPIGVCMEVPPKPDMPPMHSMAMLGEVDGPDGMVPAYMTALFNSSRCTPESKVDGSDAVAVTAKCAEYCDGQGNNCEYRQAMLDDSVGTGYMQYFNTSDCSDEGGAVESRYFPVDACMPVGPGPSGQGQIKSMMQWMYPGKLQAHHFVEEGCRGKHQPANDWDTRMLGGECTMFPMGGPDNMWVSYKLWALKRFVQNSAPRCAWIPRKLAEEINAIPHPDPNSGACMAGRGDDNGMHMDHALPDDGNMTGNMTGQLRT